MMPVVILCGGQGTRLREATETRPKPMVEIGGKPLLWHLMSFYAAHGYKDFILCLGYLGDVIKRYFLDFAALSSDFTVDLSAPYRFDFKDGGTRDWRVTCVDTGADTMTGARLARVARYLDGDFMLTYGDGLANVDIPRLVEAHRAHGKIATVTGVRPPGRFGELDIEGARVKSFVEKPARAAFGDVINGGFFVFKRAILDYVTSEPACMLEREPLERVARDGELMVHHHAGFWQCMDTYRDLMVLEHAWSEGRAPWRNW
jgi:glucose-1-phosphate cytidylyltransferase